MGLGSLFGSKIEYTSGDPDPGTQFEKAKFVFYRDSGKSTSPIEVNGKKELSVFLNPQTVKVSKEMKLERKKSTEVGKPEFRATATEMKIDIGTLWFDTYEERKNVRKEYIDTLEACLDFHKDPHHPPAVGFVWGGWIDSKAEAEYKFHITKLDVTYHMFLPDGTPVRAEVKLTLTQTIRKEDWKEKKESPDHAKLYTVRRGDTLQGIAMEAYHDPKEWRRIADHNKVVDPMSLSPGTKLLLPPIL